MNILRNGILCEEGFCFSRKSQPNGAYFRGMPFEFQTLTLNTTPIFLLDNKPDGSCSTIPKLSHS